MYREKTKTEYQNKHKNLKQIWLQYVQIMETKRLTKQALKYKPQMATICTEDAHKENKNKHYNINKSGYNI